MRFSELIRRVTAGAGEGSAGVIQVAGDPEIRRICEDSRKVEAGDLFVARGGTKTSGGKFVEEAIGKGAVAVVMDGSEDPGIAIPGLEGGKIGFARVEDGNRAAGLLALALAGDPTKDMKLIGVTGTKGKTTVAYLLRSVLKAAGFKVGMIGTVEIDDGKSVVGAEMTTPSAVELAELFSRMKKNGVTHCVMEVSSHALHQQRTAGIDFAVGIFTNLTGDHLDYHKTMEEYAAAKAILFEGLKEGAVAVVNGDDQWAERMLKDCRAVAISCRIASAGKDNGPTPSWAVAEWLFGIGRMTIEGMGLLGTYGDQIWNLKTPLVGRHNAHNIACVMAAADALQLDMYKASVVISDATGAPGRLQAVLPGGRSRSDLPFQVFVDYAHTHDALENVLTALRATMSAGEDGGRRKCAAGVGMRASNPTAEHAQGPFPEHGTRATRLTPTNRSLPDGRGSEMSGSLPNGRGSDWSGSDGRLICLFGCGGDRDRTKRPKMGGIAERLADVVIVTSDNPRTENAGAIIDEICAGFSAGWREAGKITVEADRRAAIRLAIGAARAGDVVLLAGKGHENYQIVGTTKHHFDDVEEAVAAMKGVGGDRL